jgi:hypothetical protein
MGLSESAGWGALTESRTVQGHDNSSCAGHSGRGSSCRASAQDSATHSCTRSSIQDRQGCGTGEDGIELGDCRGVRFNHNAGEKKIPQVLAWVEGFIEAEAIKQHLVFVLWKRTAGVEIYFSHMTSELNGCRLEVRSLARIQLGKANILCKKAL